MSDADDGDPRREEPAGTIADRLAAIHERIRRAGGTDVLVVGVAKGHPIGQVEAALAAGLTTVGESYVQELVGKYPSGWAAQGDAAVEMQFIGHLQTNKVRALAGRVDLVASVDRPALVAELARRLPGSRVLVQPNLTGEASKTGCRPEDLDGLVESCQDAGLVVDGLMTIGPASGEGRETRRVFAALRRSVDRLGLRHCSMGMSDDLEIAVGEGSTQVRIGTALFGPRPGVRPRPGRSG